MLLSSDKITCIFGHISIKQKWIIFGGKGGAGLDLPLVKYPCTCHVYTFCEHT